MSVFKVGQKWRTRDGKHTFTIEAVSNTQVAAFGCIWDSSGRLSCRTESEYDLTELVEDVKEPVRRKLYLNITRDDVFAHNTLAGAHAGAKDSFGQRSLLLVAQMELELEYVPGRYFLEGVAHG